MWPCLFVISQIQNGVELHGTKKIGVHVVESEKNVMCI